jgi:predicted DNA-binding WGR domain protein
MAMNNLGTHYGNQKDYENMKKYLLMAIETGNNLAMNQLGTYYFEQEDYENTQRYYLMAIEKIQMHGSQNWVIL